MSKKAIVALSGGVDSAVAARLLLEQGFKVRGFYLLLSGSDKDPLAVRRAARSLKIPLQILDLRDRFQKDIIDYFCREYLNGRTPNPCVFCNHIIKFQALERLAAQDEFISTGHFARVSFSRKQGFFRLRRGCDGVKDQSYVLFRLTQKILSRLVLPLGELTKTEVFGLARDAGIRVSEKESQDICFIPDKDYAGFINRQCPGRLSLPGPVVDSLGRKIGIHRGCLYYTVGQRKGLGIAATHPLYVLKIDARRNILTVGPEKELKATGAMLKKVTFTSPDFRRDAFRCRVKIRYHHSSQPARVERSGSCWKVTFDRPQKSVTPGQALVFYQRDTVLGGGIIQTAQI